MIKPVVDSAGLASLAPAHTLERFVSYAQNGEDVLLYRALRGVECGCYVDVGAAEPEAESVTYAFYRRGWRGINIEPAPAAFERLSSARPGDINLNLAAGDRNGTTSFFLVDGGNGLSTAVPSQRETLHQQGWQSTEIQVPVRTLSSVLTEHHIGTVHFLKIDAEGSERAVLGGADLRHFRPWIVLVEATAPNSQTPTHRDWESFLLEADYDFVWFDGLNRFYVSAEKAELAAAFQAQPNVHDGFVRHAELQVQAALRAAQDELAAERGRADKLKEEIERATMERDAWMQELFETDRHAAYLMVERQKLIDENRLLENKIARRAARRISHRIRAIRKFLVRR